MSKNKVWNRGKHNGRGLPPREVKEANPVTGSSGGIQAEGSAATVIPARINTVQRMSRDNWVGRVTPVKRGEKKE
ncbi:hypothetical protein [Cohnella lupini]|uniref:Uncharacterized protein n=1 Tax=Cohnella lupini TaxID=1294267 RepID=A0A3D9HZG7_9BACL|nr:hypothetical protein [Cohnella lupini]RED54912.1 hypothetical protein DFP95_1204 [Cohnella lupini]